MAELPVDTTLRDGHYTIGPVLGVSNFGIAYEGHDNSLNRRVAIKELYPAGSQREGRQVIIPANMLPATWEKAIASFVREATTLGHLDNASIVSVYDYFNENNTAYMVMKFINGITLDKYVAMSGGRLSEAESIGCTVQIGQALETLHAANLLHRDIKPSNIMRASSGQLVLIDFGSAREFAADHTVMQTAYTSRGFAPPEQFVAFGRKGPYTDIYALAATCYYLLTGTLIGNRLDDYAASPQVIATLRHALADDPTARPQTVAQFLAELLGRASVPPLFAPMPPPLAVPFPSPPPNLRGESITAQVVPPPPPAAPPTPPPPPTTPEPIDATTMVPEYLIHQNPAAPPPRDIPRTVMIGDAAAMPAPVFQGSSQPPPPAGYYPPNQPPPAGYYPPNQPPPAGYYPPNQPPPYAVAAPSAAQPARKRGLPLLLILLLLLLLAAAAVAAFLLLNKGNNAGNATSGKTVAPTITFSPPSSPTVNRSLVTTVTVSLAFNPTIVGLNNRASPTTAQSSDTPLPQPSDTSLPQPSDTPLSVSSDTPLAQSSDTPLSTPSGTPLAVINTPVTAPPVGQPLPPTRTSKPKPTRTPLPRPTVTTPPPPTAVPPTPANQPPPNPTTTAAGQLGNGWTLLGHPDFTAGYCAELAAGAVARSSGGALTWACYLPQGQKVGGIDMNAACHEQLPSFNLNANFDDPQNANSWACYRGTARVQVVQEDAYCQRHYPGGASGLDGSLTNVQPVYRWACYTPKNIGAVNVNAACVNQYGAGTLGYWGALADPNSWNCYRRK